MGFFSRKEEDVVTKEEEEQEEESDEQDTYQINFECDNCSDEETYDIPCGTRVNDFLKDKKCENCGCLVKEE